MPKQSRYGESLSVTISSLNAEHKITHYILYRYVIGQPTSSIDFKKISERGTVLIVDLSDLGHEPAAIFGAIIINAFKQAADASEIRSGRTVSISTSFRTSIISTILGESRKRGLFLTLAHQFISQLDEEIRDAVLGNCSTIISFRVGPNDAPLLGKQSTIGRKTSKNWDWVRPGCPRSLLATLKRSPPAAFWRRTPFGTPVVPDIWNIGDPRRGVPWNGT
jgi:hypothetical protein